VRLSPIFKGGSRRKELRRARSDSQARRPVSWDPLIMEGEAERTPCWKTTMEDLRNVGVMRSVDSPPYSWTHSKSPAHQGSCRRCRGGEGERRLASSQNTAICSCLRVQTQKAVEKRLSPQPTRRARRGCESRAPDSGFAVEKNNVVRGNRHQ